MDQDIDALRSSFDGALSSLQSLTELAELKIKYLGRKGRINTLFKDIASKSAEQKKPFASGLNELKQYFENALDEKGRLFAQSEQARLEDIDITLPGIKPRLGHLHPTSQLMRSINSFFRYYGYSVYEGPEIETNEYNFEKLNLPEDHPARALQDTLYIHSPEWLLRTHTSSVETRAMTHEKLPLRIVVPGKVFRNETSNATNVSVFYQYEGLVVDRNINMGQLKWMLKSIVSFIYGKDTKTRMRCKYYPQVEPGAGMDILCTFCGGGGCSVCKYRGWVEVLGSGMVHPNALQACGIDPQKYSGFAFGIGLDRLVMLKYGINDIRKLYSGELMYKEI